LGAAGRDLALNTTSDGGAPEPDGAVGIVEVMSEGVVWANRAVWEFASQKHIREYNELLEEARKGALRN
jgi:hypothetical protein